MSEPDLPEINDSTGGAVLGTEEELEETSGAEYEDIADADEDGDGIGVGVGGDTTGVDDDDLDEDLEYEDNEDNDNFNEDNENVNEGDVDGEGEEEDGDYPDEQQEGFDERESEELDFGSSHHGSLHAEARKTANEVSPPGQTYHGGYGGFSPSSQLSPKSYQYQRYSEYGGEDYIFGDDDWRVHESSDYNADQSDGEPATTPSQSPISHPEEEEEEDDIVVENVSEPGEPELPTITSQLEFDKEVMIIPEDPARQKLEALAADPARRQDSILKLIPPPHVEGEIGPCDPEYKSQTMPRMDRCPSIESFFRLKKLIDVHFYLYPGGRMISRDCRLDATIYQLKSAISHFVQVPADHLDLRRKKNLVADNRTLIELGAGPMTKMKFTVEINKRIPGSYVLKLPKDKETLSPRETVRTVSVTTQTGQTKQVNVTIVHPTEPKAKLGGYQDSRTTTKYLHATTSSFEIDTDQWEQSDTHKAVQCFNDKVAQTQTRMDVGQQMERADYYVSRKNDRIIRAKPYVSFKELEKKRFAAIITIQRYWRGWLARTERKLRMEGLIKRIQWAEKIRKGRIDQRYAIMEDEIRRQENPTRMVDMELLYRAINLWRKEQEEYVMTNRWGAERKAALAILTEMEADLLLDLERTRKRIKEDGRENLIEAQYSKMGKPKRWLGSKTDTFITLDTKERLNVRQLHHTYRDLKAPVPQNSEEALKERFELLGRVNEMIKGLTSRLGVMLSDLITRELTYIRTNCPNTLMQGLRKRIANCFFLLCQDPLFNPEAKRIQKVPFDYTKLRKDMVQCKGCRRMQYRDEFTIQRGTTVTTRCHTCMGLYRTAILRVDLNLYRHMLDELRKDELAAGVSNSVTFLIDAFDLQFLVEQIWHGQSALSGIDNRYLLRLCRWIREQPWSPWNCVLLTEEEAVSHLQLGNMKDAYRDSFFHKVFVKQCTAKTYFEGLAKLAIGLDERISEGCALYWEKEKQSKLMREKFKRKARLLKFFAVK